jgi:hypothetical protein
VSDFVAVFWIIASTKCVSPEGKREVWNTRRSASSNGLGSAEVPWIFQVMKCLDAVALSGEDHDVCYIRYSLKVEQ